MNPFKVALDKIGSEQPPEASNVLNNYQPSQRSNFVPWTMVFPNKADWNWRMVQDQVRETQIGSKSTLKEESYKIRTKRPKRSRILKVSVEGASGSSATDLKLMKNSNELNQKQKEQEIKLISIRPIDENMFLDQLPVKVQKETVSPGASQTSGVCDVNVPSDSRCSGGKIPKKPKKSKKDKTKKLVLKASDLKKEPVVEDLKPTQDLNESFELVSVKLIEENISMGHLPLKLHNLLVPYERPLNNPKRIDKKKSKESINSDKTRNIILKDLKPKEYFVPRDVPKVPTAVLQLKRKKTNYKQLNLNAGSAKNSYAYFCNKPILRAKNRSITGNKKRKGPVAKKLPQSQTKEKKITPEVTPTISFSMMAHLKMKYGEDYDRNLKQMEELLKGSSDSADDLPQTEPEVLQIRRKRGQKQEKIKTNAELSMEYIKEHNMNLRRIEQKLNGISKVTISLEKFYLEEIYTVENMEEVDFESPIPDHNPWTQKHVPDNVLKLFPDIKLKLPKRRISGFGFDRITTDLICNVSRITKSISGVVGEGKEAVILHTCSNDSRYTPYVLKVFKFTANSSKQKNIFLGKDDKLKLQKDGSFRKYSKLWARKERDNLRRMKAAGIPCPTVKICLQNVLVISFIGENGKPAPRLNDAKMSRDDCLDAYAQVVEGMKLLHKSGLVHADLSENNILWHNGRCYFIDVSQSVTYSHKHALKFLYKDCISITKFFSKKEILNQSTADELFYGITGRPYEIKKRGKTKKTNS